jgi:hypothetical protein
MPERRQRVRILTLKNFGRAVAVIAVVLVGANLVSEARRSRSGNYGRLYDRQMGKTETVAPQKVEIVTEAPVEDRSASNPLLVANAAREQYLDTGQLNPTTPAQPIAAAQQPLTLQPTRGSVAIVGDEGGIAVVGSQRHLRGGFGR